MSTYNINKIKLPNGDICDISPTWENIKSKPIISSPSPNGTSISFIDTITQTNGTISATKKTVPNATTSENGLMISNDKEKLDDIDLIKQVKTVSIEPVQDLHGYDNPWPAGGGKNLIPMTITDIKAANPSGTWSGNSWVKNGVTFTIMTDNAGNVTGINVNGTASADVYFHLSVASKTLYSESCIASLRRNIYPCIFVDSYTGKFRISSGAQNVTGGKSTIEPSILVSNSVSVSNVLVEPMIRLSTISDSTFAPYSNICPISGWTGAKVANISDSEKQPYFAGLLNGTYGFVDLGTLNWTVMTSGNVSFFAVTDSRIKPATGSRLIPNVLCSQYATVSLYDAVYTSIDKIVTLNDNSYNVLRIKDTSYTDAATFKAAMSGVYLICELATPATPTITPEQYNQLLASFNLGGWLIPISWQSEAGTVYGGTLDVTTGVLTVTMAEVDLGTLTYNRYGSYGKFYSVSLTNVVKRGSASEGYANAFASIYKAVNISSLDNLVDMSISVDVNGIIQLYDSRYENRTASEYKAALSGVQLCYKLATPQTYQLTPTQILLLEEHKHVWADCGDVTLQACFTNNAANVTGIVAIEHGGTGSATTGVNTVFAGPSSGATNAAPNFRSLVSADIPTLSITNKTSGTLTVPRGGTGATTAADARTNLGLGTMATETATDYLKLNGGTMTGQIVLASTGFKTNAADGYSLDSHGNFQHLRNTTSDYFHFNNSEGTAKLSIYWETGNVTAAGTITANAFSGSGASLTSLNASNISSGTLSADRLATSGATAGSYGDSAAQTPGYGATFKVPYITVDAKGRVTAISEHTVKIPSSDDTDTKNTAGSTNSTSKLFLIGATSQTTNPTTNSYQYTYTNNGLLSALKLGLNLNGTEKAHLEWNNTDQSIDFIFE